MRGSDPGVISLSGRTVLQNGLQAKETAWEAGLQEMENPDSCAEPAEEGGIIHFYQWLPQTLPLLVLHPVKSGIRGLQS